MPGRPVILFLIMNWKGPVLGALVGAAVVFAYDVAVTIPAARQQGITTERIVWQERQQREAAKREVERAATQADIDRIEADYHQREAARAAEMTALDQALQEELANAPIPVPGAACRAAIPRSVRDRLDSIGRTAPRHDPAGAPAAVR